MKLVHNHCDIVVETRPFMQDVMVILEGGLDAGDWRWARKEFTARHERWIKWMIQHGYEAGRHYWPCKEGYRFSSGALATAFVLGITK
jgi:hypothetical protein